MTAGILPGTAEERYTKSWEYTSDDYEEDKSLCKENEGVSPHLRKDTIFMKRRDAAFEYAKEVVNPSVVNWVTVDFTWF